MPNLNKIILLGAVLITQLFSIKVVAQTVTQPKNAVVIKNANQQNEPFSVAGKPVFEVVNNHLNVSVTGTQGDMIQINGIAVDKLKNGILTPADYRCIYITTKNGTLTDDNDKSLRSLLEIKCENNQTGTPITVGLKCIVSNKGNNYKIYATLSGIIPSNTHQQTLSK